jgi:glutathione synthase/RimK-type ligase-like ATP-grasp enzyme
MTVTKDDMVEISASLDDYSSIERFQDKLSGGSQGQNLWIVKPAAKSRGRGICTFSDLKKLLQYVEAGSGVSCHGHWVVQKYIENPLIIARRKFDLRQ